MFPSNKFKCFHWNTVVVLEKWKLTGCYLWAWLFLHFCMQTDSWKVCACILYLLCFACSFQEKVEKCIWRSIKVRIQFLGICPWILLPGEKWEGSKLKLKSWFFWNFLQLKCECMSHTTLGCILWCDFLLEAVFFFWTLQIFKEESKYDTLLLVRQEKLYLPSYINFSIIRCV